MNIFVNKESELVVSVYVYKNKQNKLCAWTENQMDLKPEYLEKDSPEVVNYKAYFRMPTYKDNVDLFDAAVQVDKDGQIKISSSQITFFRFVRLLKNWNIKDEKGEDIPATSENVSQMDSVVANVIAKDLEIQVSAI